MCSNKNESLEKAHQKVKNKVKDKSLNLNSSKVIKPAEKIFQKKDWSNLKFFLLFLYCLIIFLLCILFFYTWIDQILEKFQYFYWLFRPIENPDFFWIGLIFGTILGGISLILVIYSLILGIENAHLRKSKLKCFFSYLTFGKVYKNQRKFSL